MKGQHVRTYRGDSLADIQRQIEADQVGTDWMIVSASHQTSGHGSMAIPFSYTAMVVYEGEPPRFSSAPASVSVDVDIGWWMVAAVSIIVAVLLVMVLGGRLLV